MVRARHGSDCMSSQRVSESAPVMPDFRYCTVLLVHYSELEVFLLTRHLPMTHEVSSDRVHTPKTRLSSSIKIAVFQKKRGTWHKRCVQCFYSANRIGACVYSVPRKHEDKRGVCIKVHRFNDWSHKTTGLRLHSAPQSRPLFPLLRVFFLYMSVYVA